MPIGRLLIAFTFEPVEAAIFQGLRYASAAGVLTLLPVIVFSILWVHKMLKPLSQGVSVLEGVAQGDLSHHLDIHDKDETGRISIALNKAIDEMHLALEKIKLAGEREKTQAEALRVKVDNILKVVEAASKGDLTQEIKIPGDDAVGMLAKGVGVFFFKPKREH